MREYHGKFDHDRIEVTQDGEWLVVTTGEGYTGRALIEDADPGELAARIAQDPSALTTEGDYDDEGMWHDQGDAAPSRDDPANDFNYVGSKHHY